MANGDAARLRAMADQAVRVVAAKRRAVRIAIGALNEAEEAARDADRRATRAELTNGD